MIETRDKKTEAAALDYIETELKKIDLASIEREIPEWWRDDSREEGTTKHSYAESLNAAIKQHFGFEFTDLEWKKILLDHLKKNSDKK